MSEKRYLAEEERSIDVPRPLVVPGRAPVSARLFPGALLRKARDTNGVAPGAEDAVARAGSSSGEALPDDVRGRFEGSLGTSLSGVRVHTGAESEQAASAVGAKAYTVGNDIHFAAGQYAPSDPFGLHLLAHEVAHTQQQAGGSPHRQHKLEVSSPGDRAEVEADRAADAMVAGNQFSLSSMGGSGIQRDADDPKSNSEVIDDSVNSADTDMKKAQAAKNKDGTPSYNPGRIINNTITQKDVKAKMKQVSAATSQLEFLATSGAHGIEWSQVQTNHATLGELQTYSEARDSQGTDIATLLNSNKTLEQDYARMSTAVNTAMTQLGIDPKVVKGNAPDNPADPTKPLSNDAQTGQKIGEAIGNTSSLGDKKTGKDGVSTEALKAANDAITQYNQSANKVNESEVGVKSAMASVKGAAASLAIFNIGKEKGEIADKLKAAQAEAADIRDTVSHCTSLAISCLGITGGLMSVVKGGELLAAKPDIDPLLKEAEKMGKEKSIASVNDLISTILTDATGIQQKISNLTGQLNIKEAEELKAQKEKEGAAVTKAAAEMQKALLTYKDALTDMDAKKKTMRATITKYGDDLDKKAKKEGTGSGDRFKVIGQVMGECDAFIGQAVVTYHSATEYESSTATANKKKDDINTGVKGGDGHEYGLAFFTPVQGGDLYIVDVENIHFSGGDGSGQERDATPAEAVAKVKGDIRKMGSMAFGMRQQLAGYLGLTVAGEPPSFAD
jgi:hypothetical protein